MKNTLHNLTRDITTSKPLRAFWLADSRSIFYASSKNTAIEFFEQFKRKWKDTIPLTVSCLERSINACLTFFSFPEEEWISLRTTNIIERLNKEFKRRNGEI
ncbi:MAG: transposase [Deltaproteobacteria bacterium]|nr:transposase [Deltaproteobacteria bacterium]MCD6197404.1 transposase [Deltaproteobacteria bacterium]